MSNWAEQRRADRAAAAAKRRADVAAEREQNRADAAAASAERRTELAARTRASEKRRADARRRRAELVAAAGAHMVEVLVYGLAVVCAVMAIPAMAIFGWDLYGPPGLLLPAVSELGAWAFAGAVMVSRRAHPDRPVRWLVVGIGVFAVTGAALNFAHGMSGDDGGLTRGLVMAVVSVAGIVAHQLAVAVPPRSRAERAAARHDGLAVAGPTGWTRGTAELDDVAVALGVAGTLAAREERHEVQRARYAAYMTVFANRRGWREQRDAGAASRQATRRAPPDRLTPFPWDICAAGMPAHRSQRTPKASVPQRIPAWTGGGHGDAGGRPSSPRQDTPAGRQGPHRADTGAVQGRSGPRRTPARARGHPPAAPRAENPSQVGQ